MKVPPGPGLPEGLTIPDSDLVERFSYADDPAEAVVDLSRAQVWDASTVAALDAVETKFRDHGVHVEIVGLDERSSRFHARLSGRLD